MLEIPKKNGEKYQLVGDVSHHCLAKGVAESVLVKQRQNLKITKVPQQQRSSVWRRLPAK
jgi:hypothetical protein